MSPSPSPRLSSSLSFICVVDLTNSLTVSCAKACQSLLLSNVPKFD